MDLLRTILLNGIKHPKRLAIVDDKREYSYFRVLAGTFFLAKHIQAMTSKDKIGLLLPTSGAPPLCVLAAWQAGKTPIPLNFLYAKEELHYVIAHSGIDTIISVGAMIDFLGGPEIIPPGIKLVKIEDLSFKGVPPIRWPKNPSDDDLAVILYTSGTSGKPKGVMLTHGNIRSDVYACIKHVNFTAATSFVGVLPQFHSFGLTALSLLPLAMGAKVVYQGRFVPHKLVDLIRTHRPDVFMAVPTMYAAMLNVKNASADDFKSVQHAVSGGEPLSRTVAEEFQTRFNCQLTEGYGLTETSPVLSWAMRKNAKPGSVGTLVPGAQCLVVDDNNKPVAPGEPGELLFTGPMVFKGYFNDDAQTQAAFITINNTRYFRTGDIGKLDSDGHLFITGRKKEMLIVGGFNVFPRVIEECINKHPTVRECGVVGKRDDARGEIPIAFVEIREGMTFDETSIRNFAREHLANYEVPKEIIQVESLPRGPTGKVLRRELKKKVE
jgi:long-chain acyl-CoA synthetase